MSSISRCTDVRKHGSKIVKSAVLKNFLPKRQRSGQNACFGRGYYNQERKNRIFRFFKSREGSIQNRQKEQAWMRREQRAECRKPDTIVPMIPGFHSDWSIGGCLLILLLYSCLTDCVLLLELLWHQMFLREWIWNSTFGSVLCIIGLHLYECETGWSVHFPVLPLLFG